MWNNTLKPQITQDQFINKGFNDLDGIVFCDVIVKSLCKYALLMNLRKIRMFMCVGG